MTLQELVTNLSEKLTAAEAQAQAATELLRLALAGNLRLVYGWDREADRYGYWLIDHGEKHELCESYETIEEAAEAALAAAKEGAK